MKPNFFLVGVAKAGTTAVASYLAQHPEIHLSPIKEPNYFCTDLHRYLAKSRLNDTAPLNVKAYLSRKKRPYVQSALVNAEEDYYQLYSQASGATAIGECSTTYMYSRTAAARIREAHPDARIIVILRNPIERAFSHYLMDRRIGLATTSFREALDYELSLLEPNMGNCRLYIDMGRYATQLERYLSVFPREQMLILKFDDLRRNTREVMREIYSFLGVSPDFWPGSLVYENAAVLPRAPTLNRLLHVTGIKKRLRLLLPRAIKRRLKILYFSAAKELVIDDARKLLERLYASENQRLEKLCGINFSTR